MITGADGFIGSNLCSSLEKEKNLKLNPVTQDMVEKINKETDWGKYLSGGDTIIHLAGIAHKKAGKEEIKSVNIEGTEKLCSDAARFGVKKIIFLSSAKVNGEKSQRPFKESDEEKPQDIYGWSKFEAENRIREICNNTSLDYVIIRPPLVYGPNVKANFLKLIKAVNKKIPLPFRGLDNKRSYIGIDNLIFFLKKCIENEAANNETFFISDDRDLSTMELVEIIGEKLKKKPRIFKLPGFSKEIIMFLPVLKNFYSKLADSFQVDISKAQDYLNWEPAISVEKGIEKTVLDFKEKQL